MADHLDSPLSVHKIMYKRYMSIYRRYVLTLFEIYQISDRQKQSA